MTQSRQSLIRAATLTLADAGCDTPQLDAEILLAHVLGIERTALFLDLHADVPADAAKLFDDCVARRRGREPVARIVGYREFWNHRFYLNEATLVPRPDSETLVEACLKALKGIEAPLVVDFGTGSGCLLLSVLDERQDAQGLGLDASSRAIEAAKANAERLSLTARVDLQLYDWTCDGLPLKAGTADMVLSNPPYIPASDKPSLAPDVRDYDPALALFADEHGLADYKILAPMAFEMLKSGGHVLFEVGKGQAGDVSDILANAGFSHISLYNDLAGVARVVHGLKR